MTLRRTLLRRRTGAAQTCTKTPAMWMVRRRFSSTRRAESMPSSGVRRGERHRALRCISANPGETPKAALENPDTSVVPAQHPVESCSVQTTTVPLPRGPQDAISASWGGRAPSAHAVLQAPPSALPLKLRQGHRRWRTASGRAYSFARLGMSVLCLAIYKDREFEANSLQIAEGCESLKNNLVTKFLCAGPLDTPNE
jgi:hypothetical protein